MKTNICTYRALFCSRDCVAASEKSEGVGHSSRVDLVGRRYGLANEVQVTSNVNDHESML